MANTTIGVHSPNEKPSRLRPRDPLQTSGLIARGTSASLPGYHASASGLGEQKYWLWKTPRFYDSLAIAVPADSCAKAGTKHGVGLENVIIAGLAIVKFVHLSALMLLFG